MAALTLQEKIDQFAADIALVNQVVHGDATTTVNINGMSVKSIAKLIADNQTRIDAAISGLDPDSVSAAGGLDGTEKFSIKLNTTWLRLTTKKLADWILGAYGGFTQFGLGAIGRTMVEKSRELGVSPEDFGPAGGGDNPDDAFFAAALTTGRQVVLKRKTYKLNNPLVLDLFQNNLVGEGAVLDFTDCPGTAITLLSTAQTFIGGSRTLDNFNKMALSGISLRGLNVAGRVAIQIGKAGPENVNSSGITLDRVGIYGFEKQVVIADNARHVKFRECGFEGGAYPVYSDAPNNGATTVAFEHCRIVDWTAGWLINNGTFEFRGGAIGGTATTSIVVKGTAKIDLFGVNIDLNASAGFYLFDLQDMARLCTFGGQLSIASGNNFNKPPFKVAATSVLSFNGTRLPLFGAHLKYETGAVPGSLLRALVEGTARRVTAVNCTPVDAAGGDNSTQAVVGGSNLVANGDAESNTPIGWTSSTTGTAGSTFGASNSAPIDGLYSFVLSAVAGGGVQAKQDISVAGQAGRAYCVGMMAKVISGVLGGSGSLAVPTIGFYNSANAKISEINLAGLADSQITPTWRGMNGYIPDGTAYVRITLDAQLVTDGCSIAYDNILFQLI